MPLPKSEEESGTYATGPTKATMSPRVHTAVYVDVIAT